VSSDPHASAQSLFEELIDLGHDARASRLNELAPPLELSNEVRSLLAASDSAGDFLGLLRPEPTSPLDAPGRIVAGRYRLERLLGSGSMGDVHLARDQQLERPVALKFLRRTISGDDRSAVARFLAEARAAAQLEHPNVATVHDFGETPEGDLFIAMAYYPGETLRRRLERAPMSPAEALRVGAQIAAALSAAHGAGIVHRDVKPANVLFDAGGAARLADFGIARRLIDRDATGAHLALGTPAYMSPEQARGEVVDERTDLWAFGVVLYEMVTGRRPSGALGGGMGHAGIFAGTPLHSLLTALLNAERAERPASASDVRRALDEMRIGDDAPVLSTLPAGGTGTLPADTTSFVGRERELGETERLLAATRLLTLTGPGGTGKTRLALQLAAIVRSQFPHGVWFVSLSEISDDRLVPSAVLHALGVRDFGAAALVDRATMAIGARQLLLLLDNFEHVAGAAGFVAALMIRCPHVRILVTSRAPLGIQGEQEFPVPPLQTPERADGNAARSEAVRLFDSRARAVRPTFTLDDETVPVVAEICRRLDGLPLALELAAARAKMLSPRAILSRLENRLDLLRGSAPDRPARHGTMRAVIEWSYVLLTATERALFCRLAVFAGGASLHAAEALAASIHTESPDVPSALDVVESLCNKSLLRQEEQADGELRFLMLETVREFGLERLDASDDAASARLAHRGWCVTFAERAAGALRGPEQARWFDRLEREYANFRSALDGAELEEAARLAVALYRFWLTRGPLLEGIAYLDRIVAAMDECSCTGAPELEVSLRARVLTSAAHLVGARSIFPAARGLFARSLALYREAGDQAGVAAALNNLAWQVWNVGDLDASDALTLEAMRIHEERHDDLGVTLSRNNLAWVAMQRGDFQTSQRHFEAVIAGHQGRGDIRSAAYAMSWMGVLAARQGDLHRAVELHQQALSVGDPVADHGYRTLVLVRLAAAYHALDESPDAADPVVQVETEYVPALREFGRLWPLAYSLGQLGAMLMDRGEIDRGRAALEEALGAWQISGSAAGIAESLMLLGVAHQRGGDLAAAADFLQQALLAARACGATPLIVECLESVAGFSLEAGRADAAGRLLEAAAHARSAMNARYSPRQHREIASMVRAAAAKAPQAAGGTPLSLDDAFALAASIV
jgi:predicted ATPase/tRNA A-37 threonylcarbamoyl transferase component Bud32